MPAALWPDCFVGGAICLDFVNTIDAPRTPRAQDRLEDYEAILCWSAARSTLSTMAIGRLRRLAKRRPDSADQQWRDGLCLRRELHDLFATVERGHDASRTLSVLNARLATLPPLPPLAAGESAGRFVFRGSGHALSEPFWPVLWSAAALLTSEDLARLGHCHADPCRYIFIDLSRNRSRYWCSTKICGNRVRVRRAYAARRADAAR
jgi:predicted RNA-binding Zn ribbon-like protein